MFRTDYAGFTREFLYTFINCNWNVICKTLLLEEVFLYFYKRNAANQLALNFDTKNYNNKSTGCYFFIVKEIFIMSIALGGHFL